MIAEVLEPGKEKFSSAKRIGELLAEEIRKDEHFYLFSPDETTSNRLDEVYEATERLWGMRKEDWDLKESEQGRIVELLSENALFGMMVGHLMNGERAMMTSYEAFFSVILSQILQQIKFFKQSEEVDWRPKYPAVNLLSTSVCWRQDHNGFSHQSPAMISSLLAVPSGKVNCFFPVDDVAAEEAFRYMLTSENVVNLTTFDKNPLPRWIDSNHAKFQIENGGASVFQFVSEENPDFIFTAAGDIATREAIAAIRLLKEDLPEVRFRFVGINSLTYQAIGTVEKKLSNEKFNEYFTTDKPIIGNFHGYAETLRGILVNYAYQDRLRIHGFSEEGSTTTPFEMLRRNGASRFDLMIDVAEEFKRVDLIEKYRGEIEKRRKFAVLNGVDLEG